MRTPKINKKLDDRDKNEIDIKKKTFNFGTYMCFCHAFSQIKFNQQNQNIEDWPDLPYLGYIQLTSKHPKIIQTVLTYRQLLCGYPNYKRWEKFMLIITIGTSCFN